jgi:hypothetical protein
MFARTDPGPCGICGAAHTACTASSGPIGIPQLPLRDALMASAQTFEPSAELQPPTQADPQPFATAEYRAPLGDGSDGRPFSTATYRGTKKKR